MTQSRQQGNHLANADITKPIIDSLSKINYLKDYPIRDLVTQSETFGKALRDQRLETNQIRKFLDAINRLKSKLVGSGFSEIEAEIVLLKPKLAYAAARQNVVKPLNKVMSAAIDKVESKADFERLVNLVESIIAYHKEAGGK
ncbi:MULTISPECIES: type III-A CRISPR-associated protein Csm2 [Pseudanabaena]|uniref:CRISPR system Cms protein Csm2 n=2 Tax=Pseudanabaena TaxID=1152 RepID=L8MVT6_9CYAN|nr:MULTISPECIES: type III-A CRISPR-associated protein Csm2 [Pseudanabaena]ELS30904.1 CRISPR-associated protein TM1810 domain protein [Pseudanabaena biceps PCC 7429]MDG3496837.1 type III-A CRISPR-associated protein Csm2 [Pseudanabaena catenata USMAC16]